MPMESTRARHLLAGGAIARVRAVAVQHLLPAGLAAQARLCAPRKRNATPRQVPPMPELCDCLQAIGTHEFQHNDMRIVSWRMLVM